MDPMQVGSPAQASDAAPPDVQAPASLGSQVVVLDSAALQLAKSNFLKSAPILTTDMSSDFPELLKLYYDSFFPFKKYYRWLSYGNVPKHYFTHREFCFTLKGDIYVRYKSFETCSELEKEVKQYCPYKIDIGAVYNIKPKDHKSYKANETKAMEKELVFDIDMTDYDDVRTCCDGARICYKCWPFLTLAIRILDRALKDDFGFQHLLWVYSGRRGVHCWVCDPDVRKYDASVRAAITDYLTVIKGGDQQAKKVTISTPLHAFLQNSLDLINVYFEKLVLENQDVLNNTKHIEKILAMIPDEDIKSTLRESWLTKRRTSLQKWKELTEVIHLAMKKNIKLRTVIHEIMFQYTYPRLDVNVSKGVNHLLKSPFSIHPGTGRVCVPIDVDTVDEFDPFAVPTVEDLQTQVREYDLQNPTSTGTSGKPLQSYKKTSLKEHVAVFKKFLVPLEETIREARLRNIEEDGRNGLW